jgi:uncharacterized protein YutE (UPF0331/DUF86 family)
MTPSNIIRADFKRHAVIRAIEAPSVLDICATFARDLKRAAPDTPDHLLLALTDVLDAIVMRSERT